MCMTVGNSAEGAGAFVATDTRIMARGVEPLDTGGKLASTGSGWVTAVGRGGNGAVSCLAMRALRDAGPVPPSADAIARAEEIITRALIAAGHEARSWEEYADVSADTGFNLTLIEPDTGIVSFSNGRAREADGTVASLPNQFTPEELKVRCGAMFAGIRDVGPELANRIRIVAAHFAQTHRTSKSVSGIIEVGYLLPTPDGPVRGFLRGCSSEIAMTEPGEILERFQAEHDGLLIEETPLFLESHAAGAFALDGSTVIIDSVARELTAAAGLATGFKTKNDLAMKNAGGSTAFGFNRHNDQKIARDSSGTQTFGVSFDNVPQIRAIPQNVQSFKASGSGLDQRLDVRAINVTVSTFDPRAKLSTGGSSTPATNTWATTLNGTPAASQTIQNNNAAVFCDLASANGVLTTYLARFDVDTSFMNVANTLYVYLYKNNGTGSTSWTLVDSRSYSAGQVLTNEILQTSSAMTLDWDLRLLITYQTPPTSPERATVVARDVTYNVITAPLSIDATLNADDAVIYQAMEAP